MPYCETRPTGQINSIGPEQLEEKVTNAGRAIAVHFRDHRPVRLTCPLISAALPALTRGSITKRRRMRTPSMVVTIAGLANRRSSAMLRAPREVRTGARLTFGREKRSV